MTTDFKTFDHSTSTVYASSKLAAQMRSNSDLETQKNNSIFKFLCGNRYIFKADKQALSFWSVSNLELDQVACMAKKVQAYHAPTFKGKWTCTEPYAGSTSNQSKPKSKS